MCQRFFAACFVLGLAFAAHAELPPSVSARLSAAGIPEEAVGVIVERLSDGARLLAHGADRSLAPASTMKVVTSWIALERLGPAYRGRTELRAVGRIDRDVLHGDLVLRGLGDIDLDWRAFERMLEQLRHRGVREIRGDLVLDRSFFMPARTDVGVPPFDEAPEFRYNVIPDALLLNTNLMQVDLSSGSDTLTVALATPLERVSIAAEMGLVERACDDWEDGWKIPAVVASRGGAMQVVLQGNFPRNCTTSTSINVIDRVAFAERLYRALWSRMGGVHRGRVRDGETGAAGTLMAEHKSRPLTDVLRDVNKQSDNPIARVLFLTMGALSPEGAGKPTALRAEAEVRGWFERKGIDTTGLVLENGSGLSRSERLTPLQLAGVLRAAANGPWSPEFVSSLPIAGLDGTLRKRLRGEAPARIRAKTGTLRDTSAIAGYVHTDGGETRIVAAIVNHPLATRQVARPILDELLQWAASQPDRLAP
jgi:D-alanyl-D-alanine carboxypeptidase/D-alanyl-D-alanine-endopeptidase (penicillin-binding protein 4)